MSFEENERPRFSTTRKLEIDLQTSSPLSARGGQTTQTDTRISNKANRFKAEINTSGQDEHNPSNRVTFVEAGINVDPTSTLEEESKIKNPLVRLLLQFSKRPDSNEKKRDITLDMLQPSRYKPNDLSQMAKETKFTKREVRSLYRAFKQECPNGIVDEDTFKDVYEKIFPLGDASHYAHLVFTSIDRERTGGITFGDFMEFLSIITKGSVEDKLLWAFAFYDINNDGVISREEMYRVADAIHELMGTPPSSALKTIHDQVEKIFERMDQNSDGTISIEEFLEYCNSSPEVQYSMTVLP